MGLELPESYNVDPETGYQSGRGRRASMVGRQEGEARRNKKGEDGLAEEGVEGSAALFPVFPRVLLRSVNLHGALCSEMGPLFSTINELQVNRLHTNAYSAPLQRCSYQHCFVVHGRDVAGHDRNRSYQSVSARSI